MNIGLLQFNLSPIDQRHPTSFLAPMSPANSLTRKIICLIFLLASAAPAWAASADNLCAALTPYLKDPRHPTLPNPAREPNAVEKALIDRSDIDLLSWTDYDNGAALVDADNDGVEELYVWNVNGSGRFALIQFFEFGKQEDGQSQRLIDKGSVNNGVLLSPYFVRFEGINYLVSTVNGDHEGLNIHQFEKEPNGRYRMRTVCSMKTVITTDQRCRHPACKALQKRMSSEETNDAFVTAEWPHKYFWPAGLAAFFADAEGDIDNTGESTSIWRLGREGYYFGYIYWHFLAMGDEPPALDASLRGEAESGENGRAARRVLPGPAHARLSRVLRSQSALLTRTLRQPVELPKTGQFFLFQAENGKTYWAWDLEPRPYGEAIHIVYTRNKRSDYIGLVKSVRTSFLEPCRADCVYPLER